MSEEKERKCIYCGKGASDGIQLSNSDIIPEALTNKRLINKCVCKIKHNNNFSDKFESTVINDLSFLRNRLGLFGRNPYLPKYKGVFKIGDVSIFKNITDREEILSGRIVTGSRSGKQIKFGKRENFEKLSSFNYQDFIEINLNSCEITQDITYSLETLFCNEALRLAAKVGYEWYCKQNRIENFYYEFKNIVSFIEDGIDNPDIVEVITNIDLYEKITSQIELGGHTLSIIYSLDRNVYVLFSFFGLVIYKIKIRKALIDFTNRKNVKFFGIRYDGSIVENLQISLSTDYLLKTSEKPEKALYIMKDYINENIRRIFEMQLFSLQNFKFVIDDIERILKVEDETEKYNLLLGFGNERTLMALYVLYHLGEHKDKYDNSLCFNTNLKNIFCVEDKIRLDKKILNIFKEEYKNNNFFKNIYIGIYIFN